MMSPSTVGTSLWSNAIPYCVQRKSFYANGRFWAFYSDGTNLVFRSSTDGITWTDATSLGACLAGDDAAIWFDGTYVHYARYDEDGYDLFYRRGTPVSDGTITWSADEQTVYAGSYTTTFHYHPVIAVDSSGYAWIGTRGYYMAHGYPAREYPNIFKNANNDGTWSTDTGFPYELNATFGGWTVSPVPLTSQKMYVIYCNSGNSPLGILYDGSWGSEETDLADYVLGDDKLFSGVAEGDHVHFVYLRGEQTYQIRYNKRTYGTGWAANDVLVQDSVAYATSCALSIDAINDLYCFWSRDTTSHVYYKKCVSGTWDTDPTDWINEATDGIASEYAISCYAQIYGSRIGLLYTTKTSSPYDVRFAYLTVFPAKSLTQTVSVLSSSVKTAQFIRSPMQAVVVASSGLKAVTKGPMSQSVLAVSLLLPNTIGKNVTQPITAFSTFTRVVSYEKALTQPVAASLWMTGKLSGAQTILRDMTGVSLISGRVGTLQYRRAYVEWPITAIPSGATITSVVLKYHGKTKPSTDTVSIKAMSIQPSAQSDNAAGNKAVYDDVAAGTAFVSASTTFPTVGEVQQADLGAGAVTSLQTALNAARTWWAIGLMTSELNISDFAEIYGANYADANPKPTLTVTYTTASAATLLGIYMARMNKTKDSYLKQTLVAKIQTDLVRSITFLAKTDSSLGAQIEVLIHYDDGYSDTTTINLTTSTTEYACKFSPGKNMDYVKVTYVGATEAGKYLYFDQFVIEWHEMKISGAVNSYIQPFQEISDTITRDASGNITKIVTSSSTKTVTIDITRNAAGKITAINRTLS